MVIINNPPPNEVITTPFGMIAPPCITSPPRGTGRIAISPEQVTQHYRKGGSQSGRGETPVERSDCYRAFPMKIIVSGFDAEIVSTLIIWCDECRRSKTGLPVRRINTYSKIPLPAVPRRCPESGVLRRETIFMVRV
jgi:hypothetical protein